MRQPKERMNKEENEKAIKAHKEVEKHNNEIEKKKKKCNINGSLLR